jgi:hypothetical protein
LLCNCKKSVQSWLHSFLFGAAQLQENKNYPDIVKPKWIKSVDLWPGEMLWLKKNIFAKKLAFLKIEHNIGFWEKRQFFAENCLKAPKIVIITSTQDTFFEKMAPWPPKTALNVCSPPFSVKKYPKFELIAYTKGENFPKLVTLNCGQTRLPF